MALVAGGVVLQLVETDVPWQVVQPLPASLANVDYVPWVLQVRSELAPVDQVVAQKRLMQSMTPQLKLNSKSE